jgi:type IV pilus assembly protein PilN
VRISLNLASRPYTDLGPAMKRLRIAMGVLAALSIGLLIGLHALHQKAEAARAREASLDAAIARVQSERQGYQAMMQRPDNAAFMNEVGTLNQLIDEKSFSWTLAMENLETVLPAGVQVTEIEPARDKEGKITLRLRVVGPYDLSIELVRNLEHSKRFLAPRIVGENAEASGSGPNQRLEPVSASNRFEFDLLTDYNPPTPEERAAARKAERAQAAANSETAPRMPARVPAFPQGAGREPYRGPQSATPPIQPAMRPNMPMPPNTPKGGPQ